jgi:hypothetical protein
MKVSFSRSGAAGRAARRLCLALLALCPLCACAEGPNPLPHVLWTENAPFPDIPYDYRAGTYVVECMHGYYTGKRIDGSGLKHIHERDGPLPDPQGNGKIHTRYALWPDWDISPKGLLESESYFWGYTFTIRTTKDDIVTDCSATQQLLRRKIVAR